MKDRLKIVITVLACFSLAMILGFVLRDAGLRGIETVYAADEGTPTPSGTATPTPTGTVTPTPSGSVTPTPTGTATPTPTGTVTPTPTGTVTPTPSPTPTEPPVILAILAAYTGDSAVVGTKLDTDKLVVKAFYSDGSEIDLAPTEYILSTDIVESVGSNVIVVLYKTFSTRVTVVGKKPVLITASTSRYMLSVGNSVDKKELTVYCTFSDGSREKVTDYTIENEAIKNMGANTVTVKYQGLSATVTVYGQTPKKIKILTATVDVEKIFVGAELDPLDFTVTAVYTDATTERVAGFKMNPTAFEEEGEQALTISYQDAKVEIKVKPVKRKPVSVRAEYDGTKVMVGQRMIDDHLKVYATYDDGKTDEVTDYKIYSRKIKYIGENELRVHFEDVQDTFIVEGTAYIPPSFDYVSSFDIRNGSDALTFTAAIPVTLDEDCVKGTIFKGGNLKKLIRKLKVKGSYIGFQFEFEDEDNETELPLAVRITIPDGYTMADTELYFSPNRKTILGRMTKEVKSNTVFETTVFKTGYYILVCAPVSEE